MIVDWIHLSVEGGKNMQNVTLSQFVTSLFFWKLIHAQQVWVGFYLLKYYLDQDRSLYTILQYPIWPGKPIASKALSPKITIGPY